MKRNNFWCVFFKERGRVRPKLVFFFSFTCSQHVVSSLSKTEVHGNSVVFKENNWGKIFAEEHIQFC